MKKYAVIYYKYHKWYVELFSLKSLAEEFIIKLGSDEKVLAQAIYERAE